MEDLLNLDELNSLSPEEKADKLLEIAQQASAKAKQEEELRRKLESAQEKWVQKLLDDKKYQDLMRTEASKLKQDADYITDLLQKDDVLAKAILDEYFGWISVEDALAQVNQDKQTKYKEQTNTKKIEETVANIVTSKEVTRIQNQFISKAKLSEEEKQAFEKEFTELTEWKKLNEANVEKYLRLALREALPDMDVKKIERDALDMASMPWVSSSKPWKQSHNARASNIDYLKSVGVL